MGLWKGELHQAKPFDNLKTHQKMIDLCTKCKKYNTCRTICPRLEKMLPKNETHNRENYFADIDNKTLPNDYTYAAYEGLSKSFEISKAKWMLLRESLVKAIPLKKDQNRFFDFLRCKKMTEIAKKSNTTKQNIQKQFRRIVKRASKIPSKNGNCNVPDMNPLQFKNYFVVVDYILPKE